MFCYQCGGKPFILEKLGNRLFCAEEHRVLYNKGFSTLVDHLNKDSALKERVLTHLGIKRGLPSQVVIKVLDVENLPDDIIVEILLLILDGELLTLEAARTLFRIRATLPRLRILIDEKVLPLVRTFSCTLVISTNERAGVYKFTWAGVTGRIDDSALLLFTGLRSIILSSDLEFTGERLGQLPSLQEVDVDNDAQQVNDQFLNQLTQIKKLTLRGCDDRITGKALSTLSNLESLRLLSKKSIKDDDLCAVPQLKELIISNCPNINGRGVKSLTNLERLSFEGYTDAGQYNELPIDQLSTQLKSLTLNQDSIIGDKDLKLFTALETLDLSVNEDITDEGLRTLTNLRTLKLEDNDNITGLGLSYLSNLTSLDLKWNDTITPQEVIQFTPYLKEIELNKDSLVQWQDLADLKFLDEVYIKGSVDSETLAEQEKLANERGIRFIRDL